MVALLAAAVLAAASPVQGSVFGPVVSVKGSTFTITTPLSPTGKSKVAAASAKITEPLPATRSSLKVDECVMASGSKNGKGVVAATRVTISDPVKGKCGGRISLQRSGGPGAKPPAGGFRVNGNGGFAFGSVTKLSGSTLTVKGPFGSTMVSISSKTTFERMSTVTPSAVTTSLCAFVQGTSTDKGVTVKATSIALSLKTKGACTAGFRRAGR